MRLGVEVMPSIDEIIKSVSSKAFRTGFRDAKSDAVDARTYLRGLFGPTEIRTHATEVPVSMLRVLQPDIEIWRYLRLRSLRPGEFRRLVQLLPLTVVRGQMIRDYPLLQGNHRALYAFMHGIEELPARIHMLVDKDVAFRFSCAAQKQYDNLDGKFGSHDVRALHVAYDRMLSQFGRLPEGNHISLGAEDLFSSRTRRYRELRTENEAISAEIPCISVEGYIRTLHELFAIRRDALRLSRGSICYSGLVLTQGAVEKKKLRRIASTSRLLHAPILVVRTYFLDYVAAGHTRLRARLDARLHEADAICLHVEHEGVNRFLDSQAREARYLVGEEGIRQLRLI